MYKLIALSGRSFFHSRKKLRVIVSGISNRGFTLLEMVVTVSIIAILAAAISTQFSGDAAKAARILGESASIKRALVRYEVDTGRLPACFEQLWRLDGACFGAPRPSSWSGPYLDKHPGWDNSGILTYDGLLDGYSMTYGTAGSGYGQAPAPSGTLGVYVLGVPRVPSSIASRLMEECTGNDSLAWAASDFSTGNCRVTGPFENDTYVFEYFVGYRR